MIYLLIILHFGEEFLANVPIHPTNVEVQIIDAFVHYVPFKFFSNLSDDRILGFFLLSDFTTQVYDDLVLLVSTLVVL